MLYTCGKTKPINGGRFIGNNVQKLVQGCLEFVQYSTTHVQQTNNAEVFCFGILAVAEKCIELYPRANEDYIQHLKAITLFGKCYNGYNGKVVFDKDIDTLCRQLIYYNAAYSMTSSKIKRTGYTINSILCIVRYL